VFEGSGKLPLILSEDSVASKWVEFEVEAAMGREQEGKPPVLFPVRLDNAVMETDQAWAADIRRMRNIGDFTRWKDHDDYEKAFSRLLRDLKAET
jgi:TIR domain-containing protein